MQWLTYRYRERKFSSKSTVREEQIHGTSTGIEPLELRVYILSYSAGAGSRDDKTTVNDAAVDLVSALFT